MSLHDLERLLEEYTPMMSESVERALDKAFKLGAIFAEVSYPASTPNEKDIDTW